MCSWFVGSLKYDTACSGILSLFSLGKDSLKGRKTGLPGSWCSMAVFLITWMVISFKCVYIICCDHPVIPLCFCVLLASWISSYRLSVSTSVSYMLFFWLCFLFWSILKLLLCCFFLKLEVFKLTKLQGSLMMPHAILLRCVRQNTGKVGVRWLYHWSW